jgi:hypothetical protein
VGTCTTCYRYYCRSLLTVLQLSVHLRTLNKEYSSNDHNNAYRHSCRNVVTGKRWRTWKKLFPFSAPNDLSNSPRKYCTIPLNHPVERLCITNNSGHHHTNSSSFECLFSIFHYAELQMRHYMPVYHTGTSFRSWISYRGFFSLKP